MTSAARPRLLRVALAGAVVSLLLNACASLDPGGKGARAAAQAAQGAAEQGGAPLRLARAARGVHDFDAAIGIYKTALQSNPSDWKTVVELGETQLEAERIDDAIATFGKVPPHSKAALGAQLGLERAELMLSRPAAALEHADKALATDPRSTRALIGRGVALDMLGRHVEAQASYRGALAGAPDDVAGRSDLALSLALSGQYDEAIAIMTPLVRAPSATPRLRQNLALIYGLKGDQASARALSLADLGAKDTEDNLQFFAMLHSGQDK